MHGGKRKGSGRPPIGETRKVSITLPNYVWDKIDEKDTKMAAFFRNLVLEKIRQSNIDDYIKKGDDI